MPEEHLIADITQKALLFREGRVLLTRDHGDSLWEFPGGRLHVGELPLDGLRRELREEVGLDVEPRGVFATTVRVGPNGMPHYAVIYLCAFDAGQPVRLQEDEVAECRWVSEGELGELPVYPEYAAILSRFFTQRDAWLQGLAGTLGLPHTVE